MNKGSIVERLCSDLDRKEPRYKSPLYFYFTIRFPIVYFNLQCNAADVQYLGLAESLVLNSTANDWLIATSSVAVQRRRNG